MISDQFEGTKVGLDSRDRLLGAIDRRPVDHVPLCFLMWSGLAQRTSSRREFVERQLELGLDTVVPLPHVGWEKRPGVTAETWTEEAAPYPLLHKVYHTPAGDLEAVAELTADWPHGDDVPLLSDFNVPRSRRFPVNGPEGLEPLSHLLGAPGEAQLAEFRAGAHEAHDLADEHGLAVITPLMRMVDAAVWLAGPVPFATWSLTEPDFMADYMRLLAGWQRPQVDACLEARPDVFVRAEWYASPFLSPEGFRRLLGDLLREEVERVHAAGARYCWVGTSGMMPFLEHLIDLGVDVVYGIDPLAGGWDMAAARELCRGRMALWGGIHGYLQVVHAAPEETERAVAGALETLGPDSFILSPVDDVGLGGTLEDTDANWQRAWANLERMVEAWRRLR